MRRAGLARVLLVALFVSAPVGAGLRLAADGQARVRIVVAGDASAAERTAARELADYLERSTGARFTVEPERPDHGRATIHVGPTHWARARGADPAGLDGEAWRIRTVEGRLLLFGGRPRGTLYAVYRFLEDHVGVRWWTPYHETVPWRPRLALPRLDEGGTPAFVYRDIAVVEGPRAFRARRRLNGALSELPSSYGGAERYGGPSQAHTFYLYVPPDEYFAEHPDLYSEIDGLRYGGEGQLCLTNPKLGRLMTELVEQEIRGSRSRAEAAGEVAPRLFDVSQNDWGRPCQCSACSAVVEREGSQSGLILDFVNRIAEAVAGEFPDVLIDTLAYDYSFAPPRHATAHDNVTVRVAGLRERDFSKPATHPENRLYREGVEAWRRHVRHLRIWDYTVIFGDFGELPLPNLQAMAEDYRFYRGLGVEGIFVQHTFPVAADLRDLKLWVQTRLLEDPELELAALVREFTRGYYGAAGPPIRRYVRQLERAARRRPSRVGYAAKPADYAWLLDRRFVRRAHARFDEAERRAGDHEETLARVRHARLTLDRATIVLWSELNRDEGLAIDRARLIRRYRETWHAEIERRYPPSRRGPARAEVEREIAYWEAIDAAGVPD